MPEQPTTPSSTATSTSGADGGAEESLSREEKISRIETALWKTSDEKLDVIAAIIDL